MGIQVSSCSFIAAQDNDVRFGNHSRTGSVEHGAGINLTEAEDVLLENNRIYDNRRCSGLLLNPAKRCVLKNNQVRKSGYVGIWLMNTKQSRVIGNMVIDNHGVHSNAISVYANSSDILVAGNRVFRSDRPLTLQDSVNIAIINNVLVSDSSLSVGLWGGQPQKNLTFLNNVILGKEGEGMYAVNKVVTDCVFQNNIISSFTGEAPIDKNVNKFRNNIYLNPRQGLYSSSEKLVTNIRSLFVDPDKEDYHLKAGSLAKDAGMNASEFYPKDAFPDFDFEKDIDGSFRKQGVAVDLGPFEFTK